MEKTELDSKTEEQLRKLFEFAPPERLKKSLEEVYFSFLINDKKAFIEDFKRVTTDFYFMMRFMEKAGKE